MSFWVGLGCVHCFPITNSDVAIKNVHFLKLLLKYNINTESIHTQLTSWPHSQKQLPEAEHHQKPLLSPSIATPSLPGLVPFISALKQEMIFSFKCDCAQEHKKDLPACFFLTPWGSIFAYEMLAQAKAASACVHACFRRFNTKPLSPLQCLQLLNLGFIAYSGSYGKRAYWSGALRSCLLSGHFYGPFFVAKDLWPA